MKDLFRGELVRFTAEDPETFANYYARWQRDSEFERLLDNNPLHLSSARKIREEGEKRAENGPQPARYSFAVRTLADDTLIGFLSFWVELIHAEAWVGLGIGDRDFWSKGYGTDMMKIALRYAFLELSLQRVSLGLHEYNPRALRSYEKAGFRLEGRTRKDIHREGNRHDTLWMGILRDEWLLQNGEF